VWRDKRFLLPGKLLKMSPLVDGQSAGVNPAKWGQAPCCYWHILEATTPLAERAEPSTWYREPSLFGADPQASCFRF